MPKKQKSPFGQINPLMYYLQLPAAHEEDFVYGNFRSPAETVLSLITLNGSVRPEKNSAILVSEEEIKYPYELTELDTLGGLPPNFT